MMHAPLRSLLPAIDPALARLQTMMLASLDGARVGDLAVTAALVAALQPIAVRFDTARGPIELAPLLAAGAVPLLSGDDGLPDAAGALDALARLEPLVAAIERLLGVALRPTGVAPATLPLQFRVEARVEGGIQHAVLLGIEAAMSLTPPPVPVAPAAFGALRRDWHFAAAGPRLTPTRLAALSPGDFLHVGTRTLPGEVDAGGRRRHAVFDPAAATITIHDQPRTSPVTNADTALDPELRLPLSIEFEGGSATLAELTRLAQGSVLPLGIPGATLAVRLSTGGAVVAEGELVAVGEAYGVLITRRLSGER